jgi:hypothetical protein
MDLWVDGDRLNFKLLRPGVPAADLELRWGASLLDFAPRLTSIGQIAAVNVRLWVEALKTQLTVMLGWDGQRLEVRVAVGIPDEPDEPVGAVLELPDYPLETAVDAISWAVGELRRRLVLTLPSEAVTDGVCQWPRTADLLDDRLGPTAVSVPEENVTELLQRLAAVGVEARRE